MWWTGLRNSGSVSALSRFGSRPRSTTPSRPRSRMLPHVVAFAYAAGLAGRRRAGAGGTGIARFHPHRALQPQALVRDSAHESQARCRRGSALFEEPGGTLGSAGARGPGRAREVARSGTDGRGQTRRPNQTLRNETDRRTTRTNVRLKRTPPTLARKNLSPSSSRAARRSSRKARSSPAPCLSVDREYVQVDVGFKSEGMIATWEFMDDDGVARIKVGDASTCSSRKSEDEDGVIVLSKEKADRLPIWDEISSAYDDRRSRRGRDHRRA